MDLRRAKSVIIVFLLLINALLAAVLFTRHSEQLILRRTARDDARAALAGLNCDVPDDILERQFEPAYVLEAERGGAGQQQLLSGYIGEIEYTDEGAYSGDVLLGEVYAVGEAPSKSHVAAILSLAAATTPQHMEVWSVERGYYAEPLARGYHTLTPTWRIETNLGVFIINALTLVVLS